MDAAAAYRRRAVEGATPIGLIVLLYQAAVLEMRKGIAALQGRDIEARTNAFNRVLAILGELKRALDFERGGEVAHNFQRLYLLAERIILDCSVRQDLGQLPDLLEQFERILAAWRQVEARPAPATGQLSAAWQA
jgi:flagellar secretion chaperone FliS